MSPPLQPEPVASAFGRIRHVPELDGIRGLAVLAVVVLHFQAPFYGLRPFGPLTPVIGGGGAGVDVFLCFPAT